MSPVDWVREHPHARPLRVWLNPEHGPMLLSLPMEPVWATTWGRDANEWIGPRIGLPELPVVDWPDRPPADPEGLLWKTRPVAKYAGGRPFAWIDDQITVSDIRWCEQRCPAPTLLLPIDPAVGLRQEDLARIRQWLGEVGLG